MAEWFHCTKCINQHSSKVKWYLTECGHILCQNCIDKFQKGKQCCVCNKSTATMLLSKETPSHIMEFFNPLEGFVKRFMEIYRFQTTYRNSLQQKFVELIGNLRKQNHEQRVQLKQLQLEHNRLKARTSPAFTSSTPTSHRSGFTLHNSSLGSSIRKNPSPGFVVPNHPGMPRRNFQTMFNSASSKGISPGQIVPMQLPRVHGSYHSSTKSSGGTISSANYQQQQHHRQFQRRTGSGINKP